MPYANLLWHTSHLSSFCSEFVPCCLAFDSLSTLSTWRIIFIFVALNIACMYLTSNIKKYEMGSTSMLGHRTQNTQKLEGIKIAKMQMLKDLQEDNTFSFISIKSQHFLFQLLQSASTICYYRSTFKRFPDITASLFFPNRGIFPNSSSSKNKNSIPVNGNTWITVNQTLKRTAKKSSNSLLERM